MLVPRAMSYLSGRLGKQDRRSFYSAMADTLRNAIRKYCWDEKDGMYYSVDINLRPVTNDSSIIFGKSFVLHAGAPRDYPCLIQRLGCWSGFMALWSGIATPEQAQRMVKENLLDKRTFNAAYGVRTLSRLEKMYNLRATNNPSNWQGPVWGISNYMVFQGLVNYGFKKEARELAEKTIRLFGMDIEKEGALHEYYNPDTGEPIMNKGFQNWNYLGSADLFSSADGENRSFLSHPTLISKNPNIFRDYSDDFHHFNKGIKKFPEELHYIFHEVARANP
jgi:putative isomerase